MMLHTFDSRIPLRRRALRIAILIAAAMPMAYAETVAATPPMGWNSWDAYGLTINEEQFRANVRVLASLKSYGWTYAVIDEGWYLRDPLAKPEAFEYALDATGRLVPVPARFPSAANGAGFAPLAGWVHSQGLKFGIHILRGIPKGAVRDNLPVANSAFHAGEAADTGDTCPWDAGNYGLRDTPAGQAYYDSIVGLYANWGVDFLKVDCIADHPYKGDEIRMIAAAIRKSGRPIVLSLSPGPTSLSHAAEVGEYSQMWRIADDIWDAWTFPGEHWPNGLLSAFDNLAKWSRYARAGHWPDADMLPWGSLTPHPGWGQPRQSHLTHDEQRAQLTLWAIARSPLILGNNLALLDEFTRTLITNQEVVALNQSAVSGGEIAGEPQDAARIRIWSAATAGYPPRRYIAVFNLGDSPLEREIAWRALGETAGAAVFDVWNSSHIPAAPSLRVDLPPHACALFRIER